MSSLNANLNSAMPFHSTRSFDPLVLSQIFGVDPGTFGSGMGIGDAQRFLESQGIKPGSSRGQSDSNSLLSIQGLFDTSMQDREKGQAIADEQHALNKENISGIKTAVEEGADAQSERAQESGDFLREQIAETAALNEETMQAATEKAEQATQQAEAENKKHQQEVDRVLNRSEADRKRAMNSFDDNVAASIQNRRRSIDIAFGRAMDRAHANGASSSEIAALEGQYTEGLGSAVTSAYDSFVNSRAQIQLGHDQNVNQMRAVALGQKFAATQQTQAIRDREVQTFTQVGATIAGLRQNSDAQLQQVESMQLQAQMSADMFRVNGLQAVAELTMRNVPVYLPMSGIISQILSMKAARFSGRGGGGVVTSGLPAGGFASFGDEGSNNSGRMQGGFNGATSGTSGFGSDGLEEDEF